MSDKPFGLIVVFRTDAADTPTSTTTIGSNPGVVQKAGWREWFAQAFAIQANAPTGINDVGGTSNLPALDNAVSLGYFGCTAGYTVTGGKAGWLHWVYLQQTQSLPTICTSALPTGWVEYN